jgi:hypothetical protein
MPFKAGAPAPVLKASGFCEMKKVKLLIRKSGKMFRPRRNILPPQPASQKNAGAFFCEAG